MIDMEKQILIYKSQYIIDNQKSIIEDIEKIGLPRFKNKFKNESDNITWMYPDYNIFSVMGGNTHFYNIFKELQSCISIFSKTFHFESVGDIWMQSWINYHSSDEVLKKHSHGCPLHGYISIEPQNTETVFYDINDNETYSIKNEIGNIYLSMGYRVHAVRNLEHYEGKRITLGYDLQTGSFNTNNINLIPMVI